MLHRNYSIKNYNSEFLNIVEFIESEKSLKAQ